MVISINPNNVLAYYNRAALFIQMERYGEALRDYDKAIELYPDFANAYMNRSYVKTVWVCLPQQNWITKQHSKK